MLPTTGHFKVINCPFFDACICERPYCHFKHSKKETGKDDDQVISELVSQAVHKVLNPVAEGKATDLKNGLDVVVDLPPLIDHRKITYNPTPISELNKIKNGNIAAPEEKKSRRHIPIQYTPQRPQARPSNDSPTYSDAKSQSKAYNPTCKYTNEEVNYIPSSIKSLLSENSSDEIKTESYVPITSSAETTTPSVSYNPTVIPQTEDGKIENNAKASVEYVPSWINKEKTEEEDDGEDFLDKFLNDPNLYEPDLNNGGLEEDPSKKYAYLLQEGCDSKVKTPTNVVSSAKSEPKPAKRYDKAKDSVSAKSSESKKRSNHGELKHRTKVKDAASNGVKNSEVSKNSEEKSKKTKYDDKTKAKVEESKSKSVKDDKKHRNDSKHSDSKHKSKDREKDKDKDRDKDKEKDRDKDKDKEKDKDKDKVSEKSKSHSSKDRKEHKSSTSKRSHKDKERSSKSSHSSKHSSKSSSQTAQLSQPSVNAVSQSHVEAVNAGFSLSAEEIGMLDDDDLSGFDSDDPSSALEECKRIFEEYQPPEKEEKPVVYQKPPDDDVLLARKRVAHEGSQRIFKVTPKQAQNRKFIETPAQAMARRYQVLKQQNASNVKNNNDSLYPTPSDLGLPTPVSTNEPGKRIAHAAAAAATEAPSTSGVKRIARVPNVSSLINAKKRVEELMRDKAVKAALKTPSQTIAKGAKRVPHVPESSLLDLPMVLQADKSKLPINVRSRYLQMMVTECSKLYVSKDSIFERALQEELNCYTRCSVISTYRNSAMLAVNRLRKESESGLSDSTGNLSIRRRNSDHAAELYGKRFYDNIYRWILTEEQLEQNGFPLPGAPEKGHALFKDGKTFEILAPNMHRCTRCKKVFATDDDGYAFNQEDCVYHPCGRFIYRGESKHICCRAPVSEVGCCTANTHVFEICDPSKLGGFVTTLEPSGPNDARSQMICALDCEMVYTTCGIELARVTVVDSKCDTIYETMVQPFGEVLDYNTRFSGLTEEMLSNVTKRIIDVQAAMLHMFNSKTILVGHSLESDLKALRIIHSTVVDTSVLFPHKQGPPKKRALRVLASDILQKIIQNSESGHDSAEDAITCMELITWKLKEELKTR